MNKRTIKIVVCIISFFCGLFLRSWWEIGTLSLDTKVNVLDAISLVVTVVVGIYIAKILEKEVQDKRIEKDMYLSRIKSIEQVLSDIETTIGKSKGDNVYYLHINNMIHQCRLKKNHIFDSLGKIVTDKNKETLKDYDSKIKSEMKLLKVFLTQTTIDESNNPSAKMVNNMVCYSPDRVIEVINSINSIENLFFDLKVIINHL